MSVPYFNQLLIITYFLSHSSIFRVLSSPITVVGNETYRDILVCMVIAGVSTTIKRTVLALYLGKRVYVHYKPKLEKVMENMIVLNEVADLANMIDDFEFEKIDESKRGKQIGVSPTMLQEKIRENTMLNVVGKQDNNKKASEDRDESYGNDAEDTAEGECSDEKTPWSRLADGNDSYDEFDSDPIEKVPSQEILDKGLDNNESTNEETVKDQTVPVEGPPISMVQEPVSLILHDESTTSKIKHLLDDWKEPVNKAAEVVTPSVHEILQFRQALAFLNDDHPFGSNYGPASTREENLKSAKGLYRRLLELDPGSATLHFDVIGVLAYNTDGSFDVSKAKSLVRMFRPGINDEVTLLHFVQSCDSVYKRIRYLRAGIANSTLIDSVLENMFNGLFVFFLVLTLMSVMQLNPWTLLVSMSTILVSLAFALGPSTAKLIEGMIMIAFRRPYDLGDRISIVDFTGSPGKQKSLSLEAYHTLQNE